jgi:Ca2+-binding EF-hand superfamily protein
MKPMRCLITGIACLACAPVLAQDDERKPADVFQSLDKNADGRLGPDEIPEAQTRYFERLVRVGDKDADGVLTKEEFLAASTREERPVTNPGGDRPEGRDGRRGQFAPGQMFERFDANKDGKLTLDELPADARERMKPMFDRLGKQELTREEFARAAGQAPGGDRRPDGEFLKRMDQNGDGKLSLSELPEQMRERMRPIFERIGKDEIGIDELAERMGQFARPGAPGQPEPGRRPGGFGQPPAPSFLRALDADADGRLSKDEFAKAAEKFGELDRNGDGQLDVQELMGFAPGGPEGRPGAFGRPRDGQRPEGDSRPDRPRRPDAEGQP